MVYFTATYHKTSCIMLLSNLILYFLADQRKKRSKIEPIFMFSPCKNEWDIIAMRHQLSLLTLAQVFVKISNSKLAYMITFLFHLLCVNFSIQD